MQGSEGTAAGDDLSLPPLLRGRPSADPRADACAAGRDGADPGLVTHLIRPDRLSAALLLAPEVPLEDAMAMLIAGANGFADAFGALAPAEVACQFDWPAGIRINGARCGALTAAASATDPAAEPDWLVIALDVPFFAEAGGDPGETPDVTTLWEEGCAEIEPARLLESWSRHTLVWIHEWLESGIERLHRDWTGRRFPRETESILGSTGRFVGLDERGGALLRTDTGETRLIPLSATLKGNRC